MKEAFRILPVGDSALTVEFGDRIDPDLNSRVQALHDAVNRAKLPGVTESVPTYRSLLVHYRPEITGWAAIREAVAELAASLDNQAPRPGQLVDIPVAYGGQYGPDLDFVAAHCGKSPSEVIRIHAGGEYLVYMLGFAPGFPYLGGMDPAIAAPRLESPRVRIPAGSVGIAGEQTGVYSVESPGGWRLIGRTPLALYSPGGEQPVLLRAGQRIRFRPIDSAEFNRIAGGGL